MLILLVGAKGSGKSHIGRLLETHLGVHFFHVEPLWMTYYAECRASGRAPVVAEGIAKVHPHIAAALREHGELSVETTGASEEILHDLLSIAPPSERLVARIHAPLELCLRRIASRDPSCQVAMDEESIRAVHALSESLELPAELTIDNAQLTERQVIASFEAILSRRRTGAPANSRLAPNPWLAVPLADYEAHMALPHVGQGRLLSEAFGRALDAYAPRCVALLGCAGGNGLEQTTTRPLERVVAVDINPDYVRQARTRWATRIPGLELFVGDVQAEDFGFAPVDLVFAGLLFEYLDIAKALAKVRTMLRARGTLVTVSQLPSAAIPEITPSPFASLDGLGSIMRLVRPGRLRELAEAGGYRQVEEQILDATGGKQFCMQGFRLLHAPGTA